MMALLSLHAVGISLWQEETDYGRFQCWAQKDLPIHTGPRCRSYVKYALWYPSIYNPQFLQNVTSLIDLAVVRHCSSQAPTPPTRSRQL